MANQLLAVVHYTVAAVYAICMIWFAQRRRIHPIPGRYPGAVLVNCAVLFLMLLNQAAGYTVDSYPCFTYELTVRTLHHHHHSYVDSYPWFTLFIYLYLSFMCWLLCVSFPPFHARPVSNWNSHRHVHRGATIMGTRRTV